MVPSSFQFSTFQLCISLWIAKSLASHVSYLGYREQPPASEESRCRDLRPQTDVDIEQLTGMWYAEEMLPHIKTDPGYFYTEDCPIIHISDVTRENNTYGHKHITGLDPQDPYQHRAQHRYDPYDPYFAVPRPFELGSSYSWQLQHDRRRLRLYWSEINKNREYDLSYSIRAKGIWNSSLPRINQAELNTYPEKFNKPSDLVQVIKVVSDHLVLTFCMEQRHDRDAELFTLILSRYPHTLKRHVIENLHRIIKSRALSTASIIRVCSGSIAWTSSFTTISISLAIYFLRMI